MDDLTPFEGRFEARIRAFATSGVPSVDSAAIARAVAQRHPRSEAASPVIRRLGGEFRRTRVRALLAAAAVFAILVSGTFLVLNRPGPAILVPSPTPGPSVGQPTTPPIEGSPTPFVQRLDLTWAEIDSLNAAHVAWLGDRFVLVDDDGTVHTSTDGATWQALQPGDPDPGYSNLLGGSFATWEDDVVGWWNPIPDGPDIAGATPPPFVRDVVQVVRPPAEPTSTSPFEGPVGSIGIGPLGLVARVHSTIDWDAWVTTQMGPDWAQYMTSYSFEDGRLQIETSDGRSLDVLWAETGLEMGDFQDRGFGWYSPDGEGWTAIPEFPADVTDVIGVSDGFIAGGFSGMWHSTDGLTWRSFGDVEDGIDGSLLPFVGGALVTDESGNFSLWTADGRSELPMVAELPAASRDRPAAIGTGQLGLVSINVVDRDVLFTPNGVDWDIEPLPADMPYDDATGAMTVAVGDRSVVVLAWGGAREAPVPSLWLGAFDP